MLSQMDNCNRRVSGPAMLGGISDDLTHLETFVTQEQPLSMVNHQFKLANLRLQTGQFIQIKDIHFTLFNAYVRSPHLAGRPDLPAPRFQR